MFEHIHGVRCIWPKDDKAKSSNLPFDVEIEFANFVPAVLDITPLWQLEDIGERYKTELNLYQVDGLFRLYVNCEGQGYFEYHPNKIVIAWSQSGTSFEHYFQSIGIAIWLELKGILCIHANAIQIEDKTALVLAPSRGGKSTLSQALIDQGARLLSDDMAALYPTGTYYQCFISEPQLRLWPDTVSQLRNENPEQQTKVHERFAKRLIKLPQKSAEQTSTPQKIAAIYCLNRLELDKDVANNSFTCHIEPVNLSKGLIWLVQHSILGGAYKALGLESNRLALLANLLEQHPIKRLTYASGFNHLRDVAQHLAQDVQDEG